jgi:molybdopterin converting factor small subunit
MVSVTVRLSGWLASYFPVDVMELATHSELDKALPDLISKVMAQSRTPVPQGGLMITINGQNVKKLDSAHYLLKDNDVVTLIPVVAGG